MISKFIGNVNETSQIRATFSDDGEFVISGSEDGRIYIWNTEGRLQRRSLVFGGSSTRTKTVECWQMDSKPVAAAIFAPYVVYSKLQSLGLRPILDGGGMGAAVTEGLIVVATDLGGRIKIYENNRSLIAWLQQ